MISYIHYGDYFFTRLHARYTAPQVTDELMLYNTNITDQEQIRFITYKKELEDRFPTCGKESVPYPGSCNDDGTDSYGSGSGVSQGCGGCSAGGGAFLGAWMLGLVALFRRRGAK